MDKNDLKTRLKELSEQLHSALSYQCIATLAVVLLLVVGRNEVVRLQLQKEALDTQRASIPLDSLGTLWQFDSTFFRSGIESYDRELLEPAGRLAVYSTMFLATGIQGGLPEDKSSMSDLGDVSRRINGLRQTLPVLASAAVRFKSAAELNSEELAAYTTYLAFNEDKKVLSAEWTKVCMAAGLADHLRRSLNRGEMNPEMAPILFAPKIITLTKWGLSQLIKTSQSPLVSESRFEIVSKNPLDLMKYSDQIDAETDYFESPQMYAQRTRPWPFANQKVATAADLRITQASLRNARSSSIGQLDTKIQSLDEKVTALREERKLPSQLTPFELPISYIAWALPFASAYFLLRLFGTRRKFISISRSLYAKVEAFEDLAIVLPYVFYRTDRVGSYSIARAAVDVIGVFGLAALSVLVLFGWNSDQTFDLIQASGYSVVLFCVCMIAVLRWWALWLPNTGSLDVSKAPPFLGRALAGLRILKAR